MSNSTNNSYFHLNIFINFFFPLPINILFFNLFITLSTYLLMVLSLHSFFLTPTRKTQIVALIFVKTAT